MEYRYYVAIHNKRTSTTIFRPAPLHVLQREPKALKGIPPAAVTSADRLAARNALGASFGTKKAQAALRAQERNKIDVSAMQGVLETLQERVGHNTTVLPSKGLCLSFFPFRGRSERVVDDYNRASG
jgi:DNA-directed RNA polymerase I subunit RPA49